MRLLSILLVAALLQPTAWLLYKLGIGGEALSAAVATSGLTLACVAALYLVVGVCESKRVMVLMASAVVLALLMQLIRITGWEHTWRGIPFPFIGTLSARRIGDCCELGSITLFLVTFFLIILELHASKMEMTKVAAALQTEVAEHKRAEQKLDDYRLRLEELVEERTQELAKANRDLKKEAADRRDAEDAVRESEENFRLLADNAMDGIVIVVSDARSVYANKQACLITGYSAEGLLRISMTDLVHLEQRESLRERLQRILTGAPLPERYEARLVSREGASIPVEISATRTVWRGQPAALVFFRDLRERKNHEKLIAEQQLKMLAASRLSSLGRMASGVAHEINNPLAVISVAAENLNGSAREEKQDGETLDMLTSAIRRNVTRIARIVRGLLNLSRDDPYPSPNPLAVRDVVEDTLELCRTRFRDHGITLTVPEVAGHLKVNCVPAQLSEVLLNLLNNAFDAVADQQDGCVALEVGSYDDTVEITVTDNGPGVNEDIREAIFEPYFTTKGDRGGTGLGLSISRRIVESHQGQLALETGPEGTRFVVRLPKSSADAAVQEVDHGDA